MSLTWLAVRASGEVAMILLTAVTVLGILTARFGRAGQCGEAVLWRRYTLSQVHRYLSGVALLFLALHVGVTMLDSYVEVPWVSTLIPFTSPYQTFAVGLGTVSVLLLLAVVVTSLLRVALGYQVWHRVHYLAYVAWAVGMVHGVLAGTDLLLTLVLSVIASVAVASSLLATARKKGGPDHAHERAAGAAAAPR